MAKIIKTIFLFLFLVFPGLVFAKPSLENIQTYANSYKEYTKADLKKLKKFDLVVIDAYGVPERKFISELKKSKTIVLAYLNIGQAERWRKYFFKLPKEIILKEDPFWRGNFFIEVNDARWQKIILNEAISDIFQHGNFDGLMLDMLDAVDEYPHIKEGMVSLVKKIRHKYPNLLIVPNRGFTILPKIAPYIDAFKYEEMCSSYDFQKKKYIYKEDKEEQRILKKVLRKYKMPVLVLDHLRTKPKDIVMGKRCFARTKKIAKETGVKFLWYGNSLKQDLPIWDFLFYNKN